MISIGWISWFETGLSTSTFEFILAKAGMNVENV